MKSNNTTDFVKRKNELIYALDNLNINCLKIDNNFDNFNFKIFNQNYKGKFDKKERNNFIVLDNLCKNNSNHENNFISEEELLREYNDIYNNYFNKKINKDKKESIISHNCIQNLTNEMIKENEIELIIQNERKSNYEQIKMINITSQKLNKIKFIKANNKRNKKLIKHKDILD